MVTAAARSSPTTPADREDDPLARGSRRRRRPPCGPLAGAGPVADPAVPGETLAALAIEIITAWRAAGVDPVDIAVLARVNSALLPVQVACMESGIPCTTPLAAGVLARTGMPHGLRLPADRGRPGPHPAGGRPRHHPTTVPRHRADGGGHGDQALEYLDRRHPAAGRPAVGRDVPKLAGLRRRSRDRGGGRRRVHRGRRSRPSASGSASTPPSTCSTRHGREADRSTHGDDLAALEAVAALHPDAATFEHWLRDVLDPTAGRGPGGAAVDRAPDQGQGVGPRDRVRGLPGLFPHRLSDDVEGERRVFHVALTRARRQVVVLADAAAPSIFLGELDGSRPRPKPGDAVPVAGPPERARAEARARSAGPTSRPRPPRWRRSRG